MGRAQLDTEFLIPEAIAGRNGQTVLKESVETMCKVLETASKQSVENKHLVKRPQSRRLKASDHWSDGHVWQAREIALT
jgi:hypothetical protein